ncbi:MAG: Bro-N domain-containing protein [Planctomycetes bacterium]|nr:Bro-N domain-containing protein [Planctomycetota bacterium]
MPANPQAVSPSRVTKIAVFRGIKIRKIICNNEWFFSVIDVVAALTGSENPRDYWYKMKIRVKTEEGAELSTFCRQLKLESSDGKRYETDCANTEAMFRIIQSIPSPKAEPFKLWLAKVKHPKGFVENKGVAKRGGNVAGVAREKLEQETGGKVVSHQNYLAKPQDKRLKAK